MPKLAVFDLDGTLCDTGSADEDCFRDALRVRLGDVVDETDFALAPHMTDTAIVRWLWHSHRGQSPEDAELAELRDDFVRRLDATHAAAAHRFAPIPGAVKVFEDLRAAGWDVAIATGGWEPSARMKLAAAGVSGSVPFASSSDAETRVEILLLAHSRASDARAERPRDDYQRIVSIGDGLWDVEAAVDLGWPLIGIGEGEREQRLRSAGATHVLSGYEDEKKFLAALDEADVPQVTE